MAAKLFELFATLGMDTREFDKGIDSAKKKSGGLLGSIGGAMKAGSVAIGAGLATAGTAFVALSKNTLGAVSDMEQNIGGVETLFGDAAGKVIENANKAYKTAGMNANEYMATATSFAASLLKSVKGDASAAADSADMAMRDMADNANKFGTPMESIQNAYQGFAKQNYTMLDNLKLGYGGTQKEMKRLLKDAQKITGEKYDIKNLDDVYKAIHVIQEELGVTGTTAEEANKTLAGSMASAKAAWANFLAGGSIEDFADAAVVAADNVVNNFATILPALTDGITSLVTKVAPKLPRMLSKLLPAVVKGAKALLSGLITALPGLLGVLSQMLPALVGAVSQLLPELITSLAESFSLVMNALAEQAPVLMPMLVTAILDGILTLVENADTLITAGVALVEGLIKGVIGTVPTLLAKIPEILGSIGDAIKNAWGKTVWPLIQGLFKAVFGIELPDWDTVKQSISDGWTQTVWPAIQNFFKQAFGIDLPSWADVVASLTDLKNNINKAIIGFFNAIFGVDTEKDGTTTIERIKKWWCDEVVGKVAEFLKAMFGIDLPEWTDIEATVTGWWEAIKGEFAKVIDWILNPKFPTWEEIKIFAIEKINGWITALNSLLCFQIIPTIPLPEEKPIDDYNAAVKKGIEEADPVNVPNPKMPGESSVSAAIKSWWGRVKNAVADFLSVEAKVKIPGVNVDNNGNVSVPNTRPKDGSDTLKLATGLDYVPYDNFTARLHVGEAVLTKLEAENWRNGSGEKVAMAEAAPNIIIEKFFARDKQDIESLAMELAYQMRRQKTGVGYA